MGWGFEIFLKICRQIPVNCDQISPSLVAIAVKYPNARPKKGTIKISPSKTQKQERGRGGERRGLGPRNDVLTTCKAVILRGGQRIIEVSFPQ